MSGMGFRWWRNDELNLMGLSFRSCWHRTPLDLLYHDSITMKRSGV